MLVEQLLQNRTNPWTVAQIAVSFISILNSIGGEYLIHPRIGDGTPPQKL
jgi:hypothetical protein